MNVCSNTLLLSNSHQLLKIFKDENYYSSCLSGKYQIEDVFVDFQDDILKNSENNYLSDPRLPADVISCGLYWAAAIGLDFGMHKLGYN